MKRNNSQNKAVSRHFGKTFCHICYDIALPRSTNELLISETKANGEVARKLSFPGLYASFF